MAIVTFWSECKKEIGQTSTSIAVATQMAMEHNYKILLISTNNNDELGKAFWQEEKQKKGLSAIFEGSKKVNIDSGIQGLAKVANSSKLTPDIITNYTKIVLKNRLEVLDGYTAKDMNYEDIYRVYPEVILNASMYYDMVIVDLNRKIENEITDKILETSNVIVYGINQKNSSINLYLNSKNNEFIGKKKNIVTYLGRYDKFSKYNSKNIARYIKAGKDMNYLSYNTLYNEASDEGTVIDLFFKLKTVKSEDKNTEFLNEIRKISESIIYKIQELELKI